MGEVRLEDSLQQTQEVEEGRELGFEAPQYPDAHAAIVDAAMFDAVQGKLDLAKSRSGSSVRPAGHLLTGTRGGANRRQ